MIDSRALANILAEMNSKSEKLERLERMARQISGIESEVSTLSQSMNAAITKLPYDTKVVQKEVANLNLELRSAKGKSARWRQRTREQT